MNRLHIGFGSCLVTTPPSKKEKHHYVRVKVRTKQEEKIKGTHTLTRSRTQKWKDKRVKERKQMKLTESEEYSWSVYVCVYVYISNVNVNVDRIGIEIYIIQYTYCIYRIHIYHSCMHDIQLYFIEYEPKKYMERTVWHIKTHYSLLLFFLLSPFQPRVIAHCWWKVMKWRTQKIVSQNTPYTYCMVSTFSKYEFQNQRKLYKKLPIPVWATHLESRKLYRLLQITFECSIFL